MNIRLFAPVLALVLTLTGCTAKKPDTSPAQSRQDRARARTSVTASDRGRYFADRKGHVREDRTDWMGDDVRRATDGMMDRARDMGDKVGNAIKDMTH